MIARALLPWLAAACIAMILGAAIHLDGEPTDAQAEWDQSTALQDAIKTEAAHARFAGAAATICGNAPYAVQPDGAVRCVPRKGSGQGPVITVATSNSAAAKAVHP